MIKVIFDVWPYLKKSNIYLLVDLPRGAWKNSSHGSLLMKTQIFYKVFKQLGGIGGGLL